MGRNKKKGNKKGSQAQHPQDTHPKPSEVEEVPVNNSETNDSQQNSPDVSKAVANDDNTETGVENEAISIPADVYNEEEESSSKEQITSEGGDSSEIDSLKKELEELKKELALQKAAQVENQEPDTKTDPSNNDELEKVKAERDNFEEQYNTLLSRISSMKSVFNKMKESQLELETVKEQLSEYESHNLKLKNKISTMNTESDELKDTVATMNKEFSSLEEENESLTRKVEDLEEVISSNESKSKSASDTSSNELKKAREQNEKLQLQLEDLTMLLETHKQDLSELKVERDELKESLTAITGEREVQKNTVESLTNDLEKLQSDHVSEIGLKEREIAALRVQLDTSVEKNKETSELLKEYQIKVDNLQMSIAEGRKFEKQAKDQALQIGKLKHEAIILNEHLKKALAMLKQSSDSETVDKELISNLLISFVSIPRADPKKFEVLELLSSFLNWDDDKKRQAGLLYDSDKNANPSQQGSRTQNFVALWTEFLEKESEKDS